jgi:hypothetical protein
MEEQLPCPRDLVRLSPEEGRDQLFSLIRLSKVVKRLSSLQPRFRVRKSLPEGGAFPGDNNAIRSKGEDEGLREDVAISIGRT